MQKRGLGKGLGSLIPKKIESHILPAHSPVTRGLHDQILEAEASLIKPNPRQPRTHFSSEGIEELSASIREHGILQPLTVRRVGEGYELIAGERRLRAAKLAGLKTVPVIVREVAEQKQLELALIENIQRKDLNPLEEAVAYKRLLDEFNLSQDDLAKRVGKSRPVITNMLRLLHLPQEIQKALAQGIIAYSTARIIVGLPEKEQLPFFYKVLKNEYTVKEVDEAARKVSVRGHVRGPRDPHVTALEERLQDILGTKVTIKKNGRGGQIVVTFYSAEELDGIAKRILED